MPVTKQKRTIFSKPFRWWWLYIPLVIVSVIAISVISSSVSDKQTKTKPKSVQEAIDRINRMHQASSAQQDKSSSVVRTQIPVIGILTQVLRDYKKFTNTHHLHIASSYVKWIESSGAQVVPILLNQNDQYYEQMFKQTNGLLLPGGDNLLDPKKNTPMMVAAKKLYKLALDANRRGDYYPIWGTCLGLELLSVLSSNMNVLESCSAIDDALSMKFVQRGKMFAPTSYSNIPQLNQDYSGVIVGLLTKANLTYNYHMKCLTDNGLKKAGLGAFYRPLAYSSDRNNNKFITIFEAIEYPFYGVQFHPEKPPFEFVTKSKQHHIPHTRESIAVSRYFADFFVQQAQRNGHLIDRTLMDKHLIYASQPMYTALLHDIYEQRYLFPFGTGSTEEFIDHVPDDDEVIPEDVTKTVQHEHLNGEEQYETEGHVHVSQSASQRDFYLVERDSAV